MDFDPVSGVITIESMFELERLEREGQRSAAVHDHNMDVDETRWLCNEIVTYVLAEVPKQRSLLSGEDALKMSLRDFLIRRGYGLRIGGPGENDFLHGLTLDGCIEAVEVPRVRERQGVNSDLLVGRRGQRLELKVAAVAGSTNYVKGAVFEDLAYLQRLPFEDADSYPWEGVQRNKRSAELFVFATDKIIALSSPRIRSLWGDITSFDRIETRGADGVTYMCATGGYDPSQVMTFPRKGLPTQASQFVVLTAMPSPREGG